MTRRNRTVCGTSAQPNHLLPLPNTDLNAVNVEEPLHTALTVPKSSWTSFFRHSTRSSASPTQSPCWSLQPCSPQLLFLPHDSAHLTVYFPAWSSTTDPCSRESREGRTPPCHRPPARPSPSCFIIFFGFLWFLYLSFFSRTLPTPCIQEQKPQPFLVTLMFYIWGGFRLSLSIFWSSVAFSDFLALPTPPKNI